MLVGFCAVGRVTGNEHNHQYAIGDMTTLWVNKVGPYNNPQETYNYYTLPFCKTHPEDKVKRKWSGLGEVLEGNEHNHQYAIGDMTTQLLHRPTNRRGAGTHLHHGREGHRGERVVKDGDGVEREGDDEAQPGEQRARENHALDPLAPLVAAVEARRHVAAHERRERVAHDARLRWPLHPAVSVREGARAAGTRRVAAVGKYARRGGSPRGEGGGVTETLDDGVCSHGHGWLRCNSTAARTDREEGNVP
jgi:hypothetical protein